MHLATKIVQVTSDAKTSPIITALTTAIRRLEHPPGRQVARQRQLRQRVRHGPRLASRRNRRRGLRRRRSDHRHLDRRRLGEGASPGTTGSTGSSATVGAGADALGAAGDGGASATAGAGPGIAGVVV